MIDVTTLTITTTLYISLLATVLKLYSKVAKLQEDVKFLTTIIMRYIKLNGLDRYER